MQTITIPMAQHISAVKARARSLERYKRNRAVKSRVKTFISSLRKKVTDVVRNDSPKDEVFVLLRTVESEIMKAKSKGVLKLNTASRMVSNITHYVKKNLQTYA
ncbi:30S ribosomal protein S20 [Candidatus Fokinia solitaria]|uniref:Small ribosomal subunit protein bS20 n=1 Tax=Candidatus Fokinia solitaria TaxID=1802984 RepID=A0A2U8BSW7_9RICK|nr:30S ribosomal protein S20 [Candidatus Fokinia solitaria]AWD33454.1 30S ribosomal protein S20 [Candidatus Fokinia solitaria]